MYLVLMQQYCFDMMSKKKKICKKKKSQLLGITFFPAKNFHCLLLIGSKYPSCILMQEDKLQYIFLLPHLCENITTKPFKNNYCKSIVHN